MKTNDFSYQLSRYFTTYLVGQRNLSSNTIASYRDAFSNLLRFFQQQGISAERIDFSHLTRERLEDFLEWLETTQHCSISARNQRLAALKSFFRYVQIVCPEHLALCNQILVGMRNKKSPKPVIQYLDKAGISLLLSQPDVTSETGLRDLAMLSLLYDAGARVQELCDLTVKHLRLAAPPSVVLTGKGMKSRLIPLSKQNASILNSYLKKQKPNQPCAENLPVFTNRQGEKLTRGGVAYILQKYVRKANSSASGALPESLTPHCLRHSKAMHLLEAGSNLIYIRDFLGHEEIETTQIYAKANPETKRAALEKVYTAPDAPQLPDWNENPGLLSFLKSLG